MKRIPPVALAATLLVAPALLGGCGGQSRRPLPARDLAATASPAAGAGSSADTTAGVEQDLDSIDQQLSAADGELGQADSGINSTEGDPTK